MEYYGYSNPWGMALQQPLGGLMTPWGLGAMSQPVQPQEATTPQIQRVMGEGGDVQGYGAPGNPNAAAQTSQATKDRFSQGLLGGLGLEAAKTAIGTGAALGAGMPSGMIGQAALGGLTSPGTVGGILGGAINSTLGTKPDGFLGRAISTIPGAALGFTLGPVGGLLGGMFGGVLADGAMDAMDARSREEVRDDYEDQAGYFGGRTGYADRVGFEQAAAQVRDALPNSAAAMHAMDTAIAATRDLEKQKGITPSYGMEPGGFSAGKSYGGWGSPGGPSVNGARAVDAAYGRNMGGFAGLGIGNPSSYGGGGNNSGGSRGGRSNGGGYGGHAGGKDGSSTGFGR